MSTGTVEQALADLDKAIQRREAAVLLHYGPVIIDLVDRGGTEDTEAAWLALRDLLEIARVKLKYLDWSIDLSNARGAQ